MEPHRDLPRAGIHATATLSVGLPNFGTWFQGPADLVDAAVALEAAGVDRVILVDHVVLGPDTDGYPWGTFPTGPQGDWYEPLLVAAAVAQATTGLRLGTGILVAALRPAAVLAKSVATLDALSAGRVDLGVGVGWQRAEFAAVGLDFDRRGPLLDDVMGACRALWSDGSASFRSPSVDLDGVWCRPLPVQDPLPVWFSGTLGARNLRRITTLGDGWIPVPGAGRDQIIDGAVRLADAWHQAGRLGRPQIRASLRVGTPEDPGDLGAVAEEVATLVPAGVTDVAVSAQALARPGDIDGLAARAGALRAAIDDIADIAPSQRPPEEITRVPSP